MTLVPRVKAEELVKPDLAMRVTIFTLQSVFFQPKCGHVLIAYCGYDTFTNNLVLWSGELGRLLFLLFDYVIVLFRFD